MIAQVSASIGEILVYLLVGVVVVTFVTWYTTWVAYGAVKEFRRRDALAAERLIAKKDGAT